MAKEIIPAPEQVPVEAVPISYKETLRSLELMQAEVYATRGIEPRQKQSEEVKDMLKRTRATNKAPQAQFVGKISPELMLNDSEKLEKGFMARAMIIASMPHSKPKEHIFTRRNGNYTLHMMAPPEIGLPYGAIPRLLMAWITTEAVRTKSRHIVLGKSLAEFLKKLDMERTGGKTGSITALKEQMKRLFSTSISCLYSDGKHDSGINMYPVEKYELWWTPKKPEQPGLEVSTITLSEAFFNEITQDSVVFYMEALKVLRRSPLALDFYLWLTYKNANKNASPVTIPWESLQAQFGAEYANDKKGKFAFKQKVKASLKKIAAIYPAARKLKTSEDGLLYVPGLPHVPKTKALPEKQ